MNDDRSAVRDDAPATTATSRPNDPSTEALIEAGGSHVVARAVTINKPVAELYAYFRDFTKLSLFMENVERVDVFQDARSHWVVKAPGGKTVEWDARITEERDGELIAWASEEGADVANAGRVEFRDAGARGTVVTATIVYDPPAGTIGKLIAKHFQREPAIQARRDQAILARRKGGRVSMPAVYGGFVDKFPLGAFMEKGLTLKTGQTHVQHYMPALLNAIMEGKIDNDFMISNRLPLEQAPDRHKMFHDNQNEVTKVVLKPGLAIAAE